MRVHVTVILWFFVDVTKLLPMSVFKGILGGRAKIKKNNNNKILW